MNRAWEAIADEVLTVMQDRVSARDLTGLLELFEDPAVLIGAAGEGRTAEDRVRYFAGLTQLEAAVRWEWSGRQLFYDAEQALGFAAFGEIVFATAEVESRLPFRLTLFVSRTDEGWRIREFHGSVPQNPPGS